MITVEEEVAVLPNPARLIRLFCHEVLIAGHGAERTWL